MNDTGCSTFLTNIEYLTAKEWLTYPDSAVPEMYTTILKILASFTLGNEKKWAHKCLKYLISEAKDENDVRQQWLKCPGLNKDEINDILKLKPQKSAILHRIRSFFHTYNKDWEDDMDEVAWDVIQNPALQFFWYGIIYCCITNKPIKNLLVNPLEFYYLEKVVPSMGNSYIKRKVDSDLRELLDESIDRVSYGENQIKIDMACPNNQNALFNYDDNKIMSSLRWRTEDNQNYSVDYKSFWTVGDIDMKTDKMKSKDHINTSDNIEEDELKIPTKKYKTEDGTPINTSEDVEEEPKANGSEEYAEVCDYHGTHICY